METSSQYYFACNDYEEDEQFFDSREDFSSLNISCLSSPDRCRQDLCDSQFNLWAKSPVSVRERRQKFMKWMGFEISDEKENAMEIVRDDCSDIKNCVSKNGSLISSWSNEGTSTSGSSDDLVSDEYLALRIKNLDDGSVFALENSGLRELRSNRRMTMDEFERSFDPSSIVQLLMRRNDSSASTSGSEITVRRNRRIGCLRRLGGAACVVDMQLEDDSFALYDSDHNANSKVERVKVRSCKKRSKEFSALYRVQDIVAHNGAILTMKFSPDGQYLASGGEDGVVRVWRVLECERSDVEGIPLDDPSCIFFTVNHSSELTPLYADKEKKEKSRGTKRSSDSACVVLPPEVFRLSEKPVHEFHGHNGDVLDLSWSTNKFLLSSSVDKTVRLWRAGQNNCLKVFFHSDYVTCVQFNPTDQNYFITGSIDGKVRIWGISECHVVDWTDIKDIVTAVCYRPDGKAGVVGSMAGECWFYDASENHLNLEAQISLEGKKKSAARRIMGFQFCPTDHHKLLVTSADSQVRILDGVDVILKYKGLKNSGSQISASFTSDGRHIVSASEDSHVYIWAHNEQNAPTSGHAKSTRSCERFISGNGSVAIPWNRSECKSRVCVPSSEKETFREQRRLKQSDIMNENTLYRMGTGSFTLSQKFFSDFLPNGSATWPEEKLPSSVRTAQTLCKSHYKFLMSSCHSTSDGWGQVIVTGGWDGRIKSFQNYGLPVHQ